LAAGWALLLELVVATTLVAQIAGALGSHHLLRIDETHGSYDSYGTGGSDGLPA
jgi:hypothetical protein